MKPSTIRKVISPSLAAVLAAGVLSAQTVPVVIEDDINGWTQQGAGAGNNTVKDGLAAESGTLWGVSNGANRIGMLYNTYSALAGAILPPTIQAGTYTLELRIGNGNVFDFTGLNDISSGTNTVQGAVAGFFSTVAADAQNSKNNMYTEFNGIADVTYTPPTEADPADLTWTTWTFTWEVAPGSSVIGTDPYFGVYNRTGGAANYGSAFFDDSSLTFVPNTSTSPVVTSFTADTTQISSGDPVTLSWTTENATSATLDPGGASVAVNGSTVVNPTVTTTYTLTASDGVDSHSRDLEILVGPRINSLTADNTTITATGIATLSWDVENVDSLTLNPDGDDVFGLTSWDVYPTATTTYTLVASLGGVSVQETIEIIVSPEIFAFDADAARIALGDSVTLSWDVDDSTSLTLDPGGQDVTGQGEQGSITLSPTTTTTYTLIAANADASVEADVTVEVGPTINSFTPDASRVVSGADVTFSWSVGGASTLTLDPGGVDVSGQTSALVSDITANTTFTLTASDGTNTVSEDFAIVLLNAASPTIVGAPVISVNFHADDFDALADHEITTGETAGFIPVDGDYWTNINLGAPAGSGTIAVPVFASTQLVDDTGDTNAATIAPSVDSTFFAGYAASAASLGQELELPGNDDDLFNSYLALNGPGGDGSPADAAVLHISGLGSAYTSGGYTLIIYSDSDRRNTGANVRQSMYTLTPDGGSPLTAFVEDDDPEPGVNIFDGLYVFSDGVDDGADYSNFVTFEGLTAGSFTLEITSPDGGRGAVSGFQIVGGTGLPASPLQLNIGSAGGNLEFSWNSLSGMSYNLRGSTNLDSDPMTWPIVLGNITDTAPTNTESITQPDTDSFYVVEEFPTP